MILRPPFCARLVLIALTFFAGALQQALAQETSREVGEGSQSHRHRAHVTGA